MPREFWVAMHLMVYVVHFIDNHLWSEAVRLTIRKNNNNSISYIIPCVYSKHTFAIVAGKIPPDLNDSLIPD